MLDYLLSRVVLLAFLLLLLGLLLGYQDLLGKVFMTGSAKGIASEVGERIRSIALNLTISTEERLIQLPAVIQAGPLRSSYSLKFGCVKESKDKVLLGIAVFDPRGNALYVKKVTIFLPGRDISVFFPESEVSGGSVLKIEKDLTVNKLTLRIYNCQNDPKCEGYINPTGECK